MTATKTKTNGHEPMPLRVRLGHWPRVAGRDPVQPDPPDIFLQEPLTRAWSGLLALHDLSFAVEIEHDRRQVEVRAQLLG